MPKLSFNPSLHGFHFRNDFITNVAGIQFGGLCGGLSLGAFNYYRNNMPIPTHRQSPNDFGTPDALPPVGGRLRNYILDMQIKSFFSAFPFFTIGATPASSFAGSLIEFDLIKQRIDRGQFVLLGLRGVGDLLKGHQTLVYGYEDSGATKRLFMYDSNHPNKEIAIDLDPTTRTLIHRDMSNNGANTGNLFASYFLQLPLDPNNPDAFTGADKPSYHDLAVASSSPNSLNISGASSSPTYEFVIRNFGESTATFHHLHIYVRDPSGQNCDTLHGQQDTRTSLAPGASITLRGNLAGSLTVPGVWEVGVHCISNEGHAIPVFDLLAPNGHNKVFLTAISNQPRPANWTAITSDAVSDPCAIKNADGTTEVFVRSNQNLIGRCRANGGNYSAMETFPGGERFVGNVAGILNQSNKIEIFVRGANNQLFNRYQNNPNVGSLTEWSGWGSLGGNLKSDAAVTMNLDKRLEVFAIQQDDRMYKNYHRVFGGLWSGWEDMPANIRFKGSPSAATDAAGRIHVVARGFDDAVYINFQTTPNGAYFGWMNFGGVITGDPVITRRGDGRLVIFVKGTDNRLYHRFQLTPNGNWTNDWGPFLLQNVPALLSTGSKAAVSSDAGREHVALLVQGLQIKVTSETTVAPEWSAWHDLPNSFILSNPAIIARANANEVDVFVSAGLVLQRAIVQV